MSVILLLIAYYIGPWWLAFFLFRFCWVIYRLFKPSMMVIYMKDTLLVSLFFYFLTLLFFGYGYYILQSTNSPGLVTLLMFTPLPLGSHIMAEYTRYIAGKKVAL